MWKDLKMNWSKETNRFQTWKKRFQIEKQQSWGLSSELFLLNQKYVLRQARLDHPFTDYQQEIILLTHLKTTTISPKIYALWTDETAFYVVTKYIKTLETEPLNARRLKRLSQLIFRFQKIKVPTMKKFAFKRNLELHLQQAKQTLSGQIKEIYMVLEQFLTTWQPGKWVLAHNDLVLENVLFAPTRTYLIDFEYASYNTPFYDLACVIAENELWKQAKLWKLALKMFRITKAKTAKIVVFLTLYRLLIGYLWASAYWKQTNAKKYFTLFLRKEAEMLEFFRRKVVLFLKKR